VSLTVNSVAGDRFSVVLIPHTLHKTTLESLAAGAKVNLEVDVLARYVARLIEARTGTSSNDAAMMDTLKRAGFA
jgi:riboflavin synthase